MTHLTFQSGIRANYYKDNGDDATILLWFNDFMLSNTNNEIGFSHNELLKAIPDDLSEHEENTLLDWFATNYGTPYEEWYSGDADIIRQCTGLKDKNGKLIYEGDIIVKSDVSAIGYSRTRACKVHWHNDWLSWAITTQYGDTYELSEFEPQQYEIIGNIHEDPELIGGDNV